MSEILNQGLMEDAKSYIGSASSVGKKRMILTNSNLPRLPPVDTSSFFIFHALYDLHHHRPLKTPLRPPNLTEMQEKLFTFIVSKLPRFHQLKRLQRKDILVASSMVAHLENEEVENASGRDALDVLALLIADEAFSAGDGKVKMILNKVDKVDKVNKVDKAAMLDNRTIDPERARPYATMELGLMASARTGRDHG